MKNIFEITYTTINDGAERHSSIEADDKDKAIEMLMESVCKRMKLASHIQINIVCEGGNR